MTKTIVPQIFCALLLSTIIYGFAFVNSALAAKFKILPVVANIITGQSTNISWSFSKENLAKFPSERIYVCNASKMSKCNVALGLTPNDGSTTVKMFAKPGTYRFVIQALNSKGGEIPGIRTLSNAFKVLAK